MHDIVISESIVIITKEHLDIVSAWEKEDADEVYNKVALHLGNFIRRSNNEGILEQYLQKQKSLFELAGIPQ